MASETKSISNQRASGRPGGGGGSGGGQASAAASASAENKKSLPSTTTTVSGNKALSNSTGKQPPAASVSQQSAAKKANNNNNNTTDSTTTVASTASSATAATTAQTASAGGAAQKWTLVNLCCWFCCQIRVWSWVSLLTTPLLKSSKSVLKTTLTTNSCFFQRQATKTTRWNFFTKYIRCSLSFLKKKASSSTSETKNLSSYQRTESVLHLQ